MAETRSGALITGIIKSIKEYTKEDINNLEEVKAVIKENLKTHRPVKLCDYEFGLSLSGIKDSYLFIKEENDKSKLRQFYKQNGYWACSNRTSLTCKCNSPSLKIKYGILFAPLNHTNECKPKEYSFVMEVQLLLKEGKMKEAKGLTIHKKRLLNNTSNQSLSTSVLNESTLPTTDVENESILEESMANDTTVNIDSKNVLSSPQTSSSTENGPTNNLSTINMNSSFNSDLPISNDTTLTANSNITPSSQTNTPVPDENVPASVRTSVKREFDDEEDCMIIDKPVAKKPKIEPINSETFSFDQPSAATLKEMCKKLNIKYCNDAYKFWGDIIFENILSSSNNIKTHSIKSQNIFACFSQFFTGKVNSCYFLQDLINKAFCEELIESGIETNETEQIFVDITVSDKHMEYIAKFLSCKIGIYENETLKKYGNWENQNDSHVLTLILSLENGLFSVVLDL